MSKNSTRSRQYRREQMQARIRRQRMMAGGVLIVVVAAAIALAIYARQADVVDVSDVTLPASLQAPPNADGMAWGPAGAEVVIEEYGDYQ